MAPNLYSLLTPKAGSNTSGRLHSLIHMGVGQRLHGCCHVQDKNTCLVLAKIGYQCGLLIQNWPVWPLISKTLGGLREYNK